MKSPPRELLQPHPSQPGAFVLDAVSGPAFPVSVKAIAMAMMLALGVFGSMTLFTPAQAPTQAATPGLAAGEWVFLVALAAVIGTGFWSIVAGRTRCDGECIEQTWLWRKKVRLADITQIKLISVPGLTWLVVPRLVVRTGYGLTTFHAGSPALYARFRLLAHGR